MKKYKDVSIVTTATGVSLTDALLSIGDRKRIIRKINFSLIRNPAATAAVKTQPKLLVYLDTDQILEGRFDEFNYGLFSGVYCLFAKKTFELDLPLNSGQRFQIGANVAVANELIQATIEYEDQ